jgi:hypothetical protein
MKKTAIYLILFACGCIAQPYYYDTGDVSDTSNPQCTLYKIMRTNLSSGNTEVFLSQKGELIATDPLQKWVAVQGSQDNLIINIYDTSNIAFSNHVKQILYSERHNTLYVISTTSFDAAFGVTISGVNPHTKGEKFSVPLSFGMDEESEAFFSVDENTIYLPVSDTSADSLYTGISKILCFSTQSNSLVEVIPLKNLGDKGAAEYHVYSGRAGKCVVESFRNKPLWGSDYRIWNLDSLTHSGSIFVGGYSKPVLLRNGEYLLVSEEYRDTVKDEYAPAMSSGLYALYDAKNLKLIKKFNLPANLDILSFGISLSGSDISVTRVDVDALLAGKPFLR